jgi:hypothetical protein
MKSASLLIAAAASALAFATPVLSDDKPNSASSGASSAQSKKPEGGVSRELEKEFKALDTNGDGHLSKDELDKNAALKDKFATADKNADGKLDMAEYQVLQAEASPDRSLGGLPPTGQSSTGSGR